jgi:endogenous inhibitor of DNA gyrase (YacG/DUF329 family)
MAKRKPLGERAAVHSLKAARGPFCTEECRFISHHSWLAGYQAGRHDARAKAERESRDRGQ